MKIKWYGHAAFKVTTGAGVRIIIDPYQSGAFGGALAYGKITDEADIVLSTHDHDDHNYVKDIAGTFALINRKGEYVEKGVKIRAIPTFHDASRGSERGENLIVVIEAEGLILAHAGDLGHVLDKGSLSALGKVDILLLPVGGFYTIDAREAARVLKDANPAVTIPMHFKTEKCGFPIAPVEEFTAGKKGVRVLKAFEVETTKDTLPKEPEIWVLEYAL